MKTMLRIDFYATDSLWPLYDHMTKDLRCHILPRDSAGCFGMRFFDIPENHPLLASGKAHQDALDKAAEALGIKPPTQTP